MEEIVDYCPYCNKKVSTYEDSFELIADWIYHTECWDKMLEECPP